MFSFISINSVNANNSNQAVKELNMCETNNKFKNAIKHTTAAPTKPPGSTSKK